MIAQCEICRLLDPHTRGNLKGLEIAAVVTSRLQAEPGKLAGDIVTRKQYPGSIDAAASELLGCEETRMGFKNLNAGRRERRDLERPGRRREQKGERDNQPKYAGARRLSMICDSIVYIFSLRSAITKAVSKLPNRGGLWNNASVSRRAEGPGCLVAELVVADDLSGLHLCSHQPGTPTLSSHFAKR